MAPRVPNQAALPSHPSPRAAASRSLAAFAADPRERDATRESRRDRRQTDANRNARVRESRLPVVTRKTLLHQTLSRGLFLSAAGAHAGSPALWTANPSSFLPRIKSSLTCLFAAAGK